MEDDGTWTQEVVVGLRKMFEGYVSWRNYSLVVGGTREGEVKNKFGDMEELFT